MQTLCPRSPPPAANGDNRRHIHRLRPTSPRCPTLRSCGRFLRAMTVAFTRLSHTPLIAPSTRPLSRPPSDLCSSGYRRRLQANKWGNRPRALASFLAVMRAVALRCQAVWAVCVGAAWRCPCCWRGAPLTTRPSKLCESTEPVSRHHRPRWMPRLGPKGRAPHTHTHTPRRPRASARTDAPTNKCLGKMSRWLDHASDRLAETPAGPHTMPPICHAHRMVGRGVGNRIHRSTTQHP